MKIVKLVAFTLVGIAIFIAVQKWGLMPVYEATVKWLRDAGALPFFAAMAVLPAFGAPISLFTLPAAAAFASEMGTATVILCAIVAVSANMALNYWLAAYALRPFVKRVVKWSGYEMPDFPDSSVWEIVLLVRIIPGPALFLQSYLLGLARVPFGPYMAVSVLVTGAYTALTIVAVDGLTRGDPWTIGLAGVVLIVVVLTVRRLRKRLQEHTSAAESAKEDAAG
jgi:uncharacterized membrane protein YdjX (TVP38/TMEM64 family)